MKNVTLAYLMTGNMITFLMLFKYSQEVKQRYSIENYLSVHFLMTLGVTLCMSDIIIKLMQIYRFSSCHPHCSSVSHSHLHINFFLFIVLLNFFNLLELTSRKHIKS